MASCKPTCKSGICCCLGAVDPIHQVGQVSTSGSNDPNMFSFITKLNLLTYLVGVHYVGNCKCVQPTRHLSVCFYVLKIQLFSKTHVHLKWLGNILQHVIYIHGPRLTNCVESKLAGRHKERHLMIRIYQLI